MTQREGQAVTSVSLSAQSHCWLQSVISVRIGKHKEQLLSAFDSIIHNIGEKRLRSYRTGLKHL